MTAILYTLAAIGLLVVIVAVVLVLAAWRVRDAIRDQWRAPGAVSVTTTHPGWSCGVCQAPIVAVIRKRDDDQDVHLPASNYWRGTPLKVDVAYCSPQCSLTHHERQRA